MIKREDLLTAAYMAQNAKDRPHETAYFQQFPFGPGDVDEAGCQFKLLADIGLAEARHEAIRQASEATFADALRASQPIVWRNFADVVLRRSLER